MSIAVQALKSGHTLFKEGDISKSIFIIKKGTISIRKKKGITFIEIAKVSTNQVIGELSFFDRLPRSATATCLTEVEIQEIPFESLEKIYNAIPDYMRAIVSALADRLRKANEQIKTLQKT